MNENKNGVMSGVNPNIALAEVELSEDQLNEKKLMLMMAEISKDDSDMQLREMEAQLDAKIPLRLLDESIAELEGDIKDKVSRRVQSGVESTKPATDTDMDLMKIKLKSMKDMKKMDIPMRDLRYRILDLKQKKGAYDAPEMQIKKLQKEVREKKATVPASRVAKPQHMPGVG